MLKQKIKHYIFIIVLFLVSNTVHANIVINEIQLNPTDNRFIELYNSSDSEVDLTDFYIQRKTATSSSFGSLVSKTNFIGKTIKANGFFVISKNPLGNSDIVVDNLTLTESNTILLKNNNQEIVDTLGWGDCGGDCAPNPSDGKSLQRVSDGFVVATPTLGSTNQSTNLNSEDEINDTTEQVSSSSSNSKKEVPLILKVSTKIILPKNIVAGVPFSLSSITTTNRGETYMVGKYLWNFGDGMVKYSDKAESFDYMYDYPGDYLLTLSYFDSYFGDVPMATDRIILKVAEESISISSVGTPQNPYIELSNDSGSEVDLSSWKIEAGIHYFIIPKGVIILPNKKLKLSSRITGFIFEDLNYINILNTNGEIFATYPKSKVYNVNHNTLSKNLSNKNNPETKLNISNEIIDLDELGAKAINSDQNLSSFAWVGLLGIIFVGLISMFLIKKRQEPKDYIEDEVRSEDMTIIE